MVYEMSPLVHDKIQNLFTSLVKAKKSYAQMAVALANKQLRLMIFGLAQESRQYATELDAYIHTLGLNIDQTAGEMSRPGKGLAEEHAVPKMEEEKNIIQWCVRSEKSILMVYRELLNEPYLYEGIRKMIRYQLNGLMHSFAQLKLLKAMSRP